MRYEVHKLTKRKHRHRLRTLVVLILLAVLLFGAVVVIRKEYYNNLEPVSANETSQLVTISSGTSVNDIAALLKQKGLIRSEWAFKWYVRDQSVRELLQAGTYNLRPNQSVPQIVAQLTGGKIATNLVTILPSRRLDQVRDDLIKAGFAESEVAAALQPTSYGDHPVLAYLPKNASLEGLLYPDSFQKTADTVPSQIVRQSLTLMYKQLKPDVRDAMAARGLTVYEGITLASIVEREVHNPEDMKKVAQVLLRRLNENRLLQSDVTALYGAAIAGAEPSVNYDSPYNSYLHKGLPPTPIGNVTSMALQAVANPAKTNYLFFVSGDDGRTHFSHTLEEHEANIERYCKKLCQ